MSNFRLAFRTLSKTPFVTGVAILSLSLGIGANSAIFSLFNQMLLRDLPVLDPKALVNLSAPGPKPGSTSCNMSGDCSEVFSYPMFRDLERVQNVFTGIAAHNGFSANLARTGRSDDDLRLHRRAGCGRGTGASSAVAALRDPGARSLRAHNRNGHVDDGRAGRRLHPRPSCVTSRSNARIEI